jgi:hypothetical protein
LLQRSRALPTGRRSQRPQGALSQQPPPKPNRRVQCDRTLVELWQRVPVRYYNPLQKEAALCQFGCYQGCFATRGVDAQEEPTDDTCRQTANQNQNDRRTEETHRAMVRGKRQRCTLRNDVSAPRPQSPSQKAKGATHQNMMVRICSPTTNRFRAPTVSVVKARAPAGGFPLGFVTEYTDRRRKRKTRSSKLVVADERAPR